MIPVRIEGLSKSYDGSKVVLDRTDLSIEAGEMFFLLGASGSGKTTLLRLLAGFLRPDTGRILFGETDVAELPPEKRDVGMVFQNYALWPHMDVLGNVSFPLEMKNVPAVERHSAAREMLELVELPGFEKRRIGELSGGQQQRVALARALVGRPRLLLLDEPLSNLDARLRQSMRVEIRRVCKSAGVTAVYVTHDQGEALSTADRIALLEGGRVAQVGTPRELYERPANRKVAEFVGESNFLEGKIATEGIVATEVAHFHASSATSLPAGRAVTVSIRPERIRFEDRKERGPNQILGEIEGGAFLGSLGAWTVRVGETRLQVHEVAPPERTAGDPVMLYVDPSDVVILDRD